MSEVPLQGCTSSHEMAACPPAGTSSGGDTCKVDACKVDARACNIRMLAYLVIYDSRKVSLEPPLLSRHPSQRNPHGVCQRHETASSFGENKTSQPNPTEAALPLEARNGGMFSQILHVGCTICTIHVSRPRNARGNPPAFRGRDLFMLGKEVTWDFCEHTDFKNSTSF